MIFIKKKMSKLIRTIFAAIPVLISCVESVNMDSVEEMPVVVNCVLTREGQSEGPSLSGLRIPTQKLELFYAKRSSEAGFVDISNAIVKVSGGGESYEFKWDGECWYCDFLPQFGAEYVLNVTMDNGHELKAKTVYPKDCSIIGVSLYADGKSNSFAQYYQVRGLSDNEDAYIWITAAEHRPDIVSFCTSHPGADDSNIVQEAWQDLPISKNLQRNYGNLPLSEAGEKYWLRYLKEAYDLPVHKSYLRIHHSISLDGWRNDLPVYNYIMMKGFGEQFLQNAFVLSADDIEISTSPQWVGPPMVSLPIKVRFLSKEYDKYLTGIVNSTLSSDELSLKFFSPDATYTNIEGGIGVFGAVY